jgi:hypothetical protein
MSDIFIEAPVIVFLLLIWSVRWELIIYVSVSLSIITPQTTPYASRAGHFLSVNDAHWHMSPTISAPALDLSSSPVVPQDSSAGQAGDPGQPVLTLPNGQLPRGFVPITVSSPSQPPPPQMVPTFSYSTPSAPTNITVASPRMPLHTNSRALYGVPIPDTSSSSGRPSSHNSVRVPVTSTTGESSIMCHLQAFSHSQMS